MSVTGSVTRSKIDIKIEYTHYPWDFIKLYFCMGLIYKDIKSVLGSRRDFNISERYLKRLLSVGVFHVVKATLISQKCVPFILLFVNILPNILSQLRTRYVLLVRFLGMKDKQK